MSPTNVLHFQYLYASNLKTALVKLHRFVVSSASLASLTPESHDKKLDSRPLGVGSSVWLRVGLLFRLRNPTFSLELVIAFTFRATGFHQRRDNANGLFVTAPSCPRPLDLARYLTTRKHHFPCFAYLRVNAAARHHLRGRSTSGI